MGRRKDPCWKHAKDLSTGSDVSFQCNYCLGIYKGGASRLKAHLSKKRDGGIGPCQKVPDDVVEKISNYEKVSLDMENESMSYSLPSSSNRNLRARVHEEKKDKECVDDKLVSFLTAFDLPSELVKSSFFSDFVKAVAEYGSDYKLPDQLILFFLKIGYDSRVKSYIDKVEQSLGETGCTLTFYRGGLYAYSPCGVLYQHATTEGSDDKTLHTISTFVDSIGPTRVLQIFFDDQATLGSRLKNSLIQGYQWMNIGNSPTYEIQGLWQGMFQLWSLRQTIDSAYKMTTKINNHWTHVRVDKDKYLAAFGNYISVDFYPLQDTMDNFSRLKVLLKFRDEGQQIIVQDTIKAIDDEKNYVDHLIHCEKFWDQAKEWVSVLEPLLEALFLTSNVRCPASGYLYQIMEKVRVAIAKCCHMGQANVERLIHLFHEFQGKFMHPMYAVAAFLNPAYVYTESLKEYDELRRGIDIILSHLVENDERRAFENEFNRYRLKDPDIFTTTAKSMLESYHPAKWWKRYGNCIPTLQKYAVRILSQPCNSLYCNELDLRRKFGWNYQNGAAATMMENFEKLEGQMLTAIDISNPGLPEWLTERVATEGPRIRDEALGMLKEIQAAECPFCGHLPSNG